jgi:choline kinase
MVEVGGAPLLEWQRHALREAGVEDVVVVRGWSRSRIGGSDLRTIDNLRWDQTNMVESLRCAFDELHGDVLIAYTDLLYLPDVVRLARASSADVGVVVDVEWRRLWERRMEDPLSDAESLRVDSTGRILEIGQRPRALAEIQAQYIGMVRLSAAGCDIVRRHLERAVRDDAQGNTAFGSARTLAEAHMTDLLMGLVGRDVPVMAIPIRGGWTEIDAPHDLEVAEELLASSSWSALRELRPPIALRKPA